MCDLRAYVENQTQGSGACLAKSISWMLGIPEFAVPNFTKSPNFWEAVDRYLLCWGLCIQTYDSQDVDYVLRTGFNESNESHCIVRYKQGKLLYDSYPLGGSLKTHILDWVIVPIVMEGHQQLPKM